MQVRIHLAPDPEHVQYSGQRLHILHAASIFQICTVSLADKTCAHNEGRSLGGAASRGEKRGRPQDQGKALIVSLLHGLVHQTLMP